MKPHEETLLKQKDFIFAVAKDLINPNDSNTNVQEILTAYHEIDKTIKVSAECQSCLNIYKNSFTTILDYCNDKNWFQVEAYNPVVTSKPKK